MTTPYDAGLFGQAEEHFTRQEEQPPEVDDAPDDEYSARAHEVLAALRAVGYAVVKLPESTVPRTSADEDGLQLLAAWRWDQWEVALWNDELPICLNDGTEMSVTNARALAAALLAAADAAAALDRAERARAVTVTIPSAEHNTVDPVALRDEWRRNRVWYESGLR